MESNLDALDLGHQMQKLQKAGRPRHTYKCGKEIKDTYVTLEVAETQEKGGSEFTENASLRQVLCLLPSDDAVIEANESSDDSIDDAKKMTKKGNLGQSKALSAFIRVSKQAAEIGAKPKSVNIIRQSKKAKPIRK